MRGHAIAYITVHVSRRVAGSVLQANSMLKMSCEGAIYQLRRTFNSTGLSVFHMVAYDSDVWVPQTVIFRPPALNSKPSRLLHSQIIGHGVGLE